jgi:hypothetical protein
MGVTGIEFYFIFIGHSKFLKGCPKKKIYPSLQLISVKQKFYLKTAHAKN